MKTKTFILVVIATLSLAVYAQTGGTGRSEPLVKRINMETEAVDAMLPQINILIKKGEKAQAKEMIEKALKQTAQAEVLIKHLLQTDEAAAEEVPSLAQIQETRQYLTDKANRLRYTGVYLQCEAEMFESDYPVLEAEVRNGLNGSDVLFADSAGVSDWTVTVSARAREYRKNDFGGILSYFSYVDARTTIVKASTGKRVYDNTFTEKGGSPLGFVQAAEEAYLQIAPLISEAIKKQIEQ